MGLFDDDDFDADDNDTDALFGEAPSAQTAHAAPALQPARDSDILYGHAVAEATILKWIHNNAMPQALMLVGPQGIGKSTLAFRVARFLLAGAQGDTLQINPDHAVFKRIASGGHPDFMSIARTFDDKKGKLKAEIGVDEARPIAPFLRKTASDGGWRVVIIDDADCLNRNAQNALLKILEEPPSRTVLILVTSSLGQLIPTIRSRARVLHMQPLMQADFDMLLGRAHPDLPASGRALLFAMANGSVGRAVSLLAEGGIGGLMGMMDMLAALPKVSAPELLELSERLAVSGTPDPLEIFMNVTRFVLAMGAQGQGLAVLPPPVQALVLNAGPNACLSARDALEQHWTVCDNGALDRRYIAFEALKILNTYLVHKVQDAA